jgi:hypothetical protein
MSELIRVLGGASAGEGELRAAAESRPYLGKAFR